MQSQCFLSFPPLSYTYHNVCSLVVSDVSLAGNLPRHSLTSSTNLDIQKLLLKKVVLLTAKICKGVSIFKFMDRIPHCKHWVPESLDHEELMNDSDPRNYHNSLHVIAKINCKSSKNKIMCHMILILNWSSYCVSTEIRILIRKYLLSVLWLYSV